MIFVATTLQYDHSIIETRKCLAGGGSSACAQWPSCSVDAVQSTGVTMCLANGALAASECHCLNSTVVNATTLGQGLTLVHFSAQPKPCWSHFSLSPCLIDWRKFMHPTFPTKRAYVEPNS